MHSLITRQDEELGEYFECRHCRRCYLPGQGLDGECASSPHESVTPWYLTAGIIGLLCGLALLGGFFHKLTLPDQKQESHK